VLEATMICMDNSEWTRNGDYGPTRWESSQDAANIICEAKTQQNPESTVGVLSLGGKRIEVLLTPTADIGRMLAVIQSIKINGESDFLTGVQVAQLALKHRQNKNQRQRIVVFVGSPVKNEARELIALGKKLKKNNVALDVINFGQAENEQKLEEFVKAANTSDNSHYLNIPPGVQMLSDAIISSAIVSDEGGAEAADIGGGAGGAEPRVPGGQFSEFGGIDPNLDPELAMAIRMSMEEEKARQERIKKEEEAKNPAGAQEIVVQENQMKDIEESKQLHEDEDEGMTEEELLEQAKLISMQEENKVSEKKPEEASQENSHVFQDHSFVQDMLKNLPGVNIESHEIQEILNEMKKKGGKER